MKKHILIGAGIGLVVGVLVIISIYILSATVNSNLLYVFAMPLAVIGIVANMLGSNTYEQESSLMTAYYFGHFLCIIMGVFFGIICGFTYSIIKKQ